MQHIEVSQFYVGSYAERNCHKSHLNEMAFSDNSTRLSFRVQNRIIAVICSFLSVWTIVTQPADRPTLPFIVCSEQRRRLEGNKTHSIAAPGQKLLQHESPERKHLLSSATAEIIKNSQHSSVCFLTVTGNSTHSCNLHWYSLLKSLLLWCIRVCHVNGIHLWSDHAQLNVATQTRRKNDGI